MKQEKNYVEEYVNINGAEHYLLHYKANPEAPVLLFLHGGPGQSESMMAYIVEDYAKRNYNIVYYDQRGAGKTFLKNKKLRANTKILKEDLLEIVLYLKKMYGKDKIGILGHSWGSALGSMFVLEHPEHVLCYIGCGQLVNVMENERVGYQKLKETIKQGGDQKDLEQLKKIGKYPLEGEFNKEFMHKMGQVRKLQGKYNLAIKADKSMVRMIMKSPIIGFRDFYPFMVGSLNNKQVISELLALDLCKIGVKYDVPMYYVLGENDQQTPIEMGVEYYEEIEAPYKKLYVIKNAGHAPMMENTQDYRKAVCEIVNEMTKSEN